jgi:hypothetical protein
MCEKIYVLAIIKKVKAIFSLFFIVRTYSSIIIEVDYIFW